MNTVIVGATGMIGSAICQRMLQAGHEVTALVRGATRSALPVALKKVYMDD